MFTILGFTFTKATQLNMGTNTYKFTRLTWQGYILHILQHFASKLFAVLQNLKFSF